MQHNKTTQIMSLPSSATSQQSSINANELRQAACNAPWNVLFCPTCLPATLADAHNVCPNNSYSWVLILTCPIPVVVHGMYAANAAVNESKWLSLTQFTIMVTEIIVSLQSVLQAANSESVHLSCHHLIIRTSLQWHMMIHK